MRDPRLTKLAEVLVNYSVAVQSGQLVRISGPPVATPLVIELYRSVIKAGGHPMVRMTPEALSEIFIKNGSDDQLKYVNPITQFEGDKIDCSIGIWANENTKAMSNVDPARIGLAESARKPISKRFLQRAAEGTLKWAGTQFPCQASAQDE